MVPKFGRFRRSSEEVVSGLSRDPFRRSLYPISNARSLGVVQERTFRCPTSSD